MSLSIPLGRVGYGNQIFIIGAAISLSKRGIKTKVLSYLDKSDSVTYLFSEPRSNFSIHKFHKYGTYGLYKFLRERFPSAEDLVKRLFKFKESTGYDEINFLIDSRKVRILDSYFQDFRFLMSIKEDFQIATKIKTKSEQLLSLEPYFNGKVLGIHVRRGDFKLHHQTFGLLSESYYSSAISTLDLIDFDRIVVFSDDPDWCRNMTIENQLPLIVERGNLESTGETHYLLGQCDTLICANSTFSLTSAYLWEVRNVIAPRNIYFDRKIPENLTSSYPSHWSTVESSWEII